MLKNVKASRPKKSYAFSSINILLTIIDKVLKNVKQCRAAVGFLFTWDKRRYLDKNNIKTHFS